VTVFEEQCMNTTKLSSLLFKAGVVVTMVAVVWWGLTYGQMAVDLGTGFNKALTCLFASGGMCGFTGSLSALGGGTPYEPLVFWLGVALLAAGLVLGFLRKR